MVRQVSGAPPGVVRQVSGAPPGAPTTALGSPLVTLLWGAAPSSAEQQGSMQTSPTVSYAPMTPRSTRSAIQPTGSFTPTWTYALPGSHAPSATRFPSSAAAVGVVRVTGCSGPMVPAAPATATPGVRRGAEASGPVPSAGSSEGDLAGAPLAPRGLADGAQTGSAGTLEARLQALQDMAQRGASASERAGTPGRLRRPVELTDSPEDARPGFSVAACFGGGSVDREHARACRSAELLVPTRQLGRSTT